MRLRHDDTASDWVETDLDFERESDYQVRFLPFNDTHVPATLLELEITTAPFHRQRIEKKPL